MNDTILEVHDLQFKRGNREILNIERFSLQEGETIALIGPNGAGKSTFLQVMALLLKPTRGTVAFRGVPVTSRNALAIRRRMAVVFQEPLLLNTTVYDNVATGLKLRGVPREEIKKRVGRWLELLDIAHLAGRRSHQLSGGEAQRVSLARAFALEPDVLFLDEPFSALDFPTRLSLLNELDRLLKETGITAVFVTHDFSEVPYLTDRVAVLKNGRLVKTGTFEEIFKVKPRRENYITSLYRVFESDAAG
ncbi:carbohydrate ABC transporter ATP-binding protein, CUT1 family (TC 3.A.1.1.-) [Desulfofundulus australicus DSM 11792]|uniref:Carbohydrate ABC transporter ATP-binding protein, CUT1 family (TC 3.A.1.1.-) n=1 Tax=Desulfofundulus australicus DSM 11792 TaxID=1121425 RepID=A0A1M4XEE4_9FIRM|nr:ATP-binding cassette domain-containing protein [Desulfofundulus australicus]SHE91798.1 carbohydrate ABC transporter ATP-binding protein, CUT1 family (TC 3.A.1.1.-) [Desulfofundulus australicus DSM 11792]